MLALLLVATGAGAGVLAWRLGQVSAGRHDAPAGTGNVIRGYWVTACVLFAAGVASLL